jgi:8-oxo-dGTP pyrophosphatase MutT (NUDIX family)
MRWLWRLNRLRWRVLRPVTVGVRVLLVRDCEVLLVRHTYIRGWYLPGGGLKRGEIPEDAARREAREEAGATLGALELAGVYSTFREGKSDHVILFRCEDFTLAPNRSREIAEARFFPLDAIPPGTNAGARRRIEEHRRGEPVPRTGPW